ncbi:MAG: sulfurtransferase TusA family protein [Geminicoccaceae bacterium]|nr:sulfurtransferase TusA family protein [Geminicoccaceae bacterium]
MAEAELDARGLSCPLPVLKAQKRLRDLPGGGRLLVRTTDPKAPDDFRHFCAERGHRLVDLAAEGEGHRIVIEKHG